MKRKNRLKRTLGGILIAILLLFFAALAAAPPLVLKSMIGFHVDSPGPDLEELGIDARKGSLTTDDGLTLVNWMFLPQGDAKGSVIILSGSHNPSVTAFYPYAEVFRENGWAVMLLEMRGHAESEGDTIACGLQEWRDVKAGVQWLLEQPSLSGLPLVVMGTSMGGATAIVSAGEIPEIDAVIAVSAFSSFPHAFADVMALQSGWPAWFCALERPFVSFWLGMRFGFDSLRYTPIKEIAKRGGMPLLLVHTEQDSQVPFESFERLKKAALENGLDLTAATREEDGHFYLRSETYELNDDPEFRDLLLGFLDHAAAKADA